MLLPYSVCVCVSWMLIFRIIVPYIYIYTVIIKELVNPLCMCAPFETSPKMADSATQNYSI